MTHPATRVAIVCLGGFLVRTAGHLLCQFVLALGHTKVECILPMVGVALLTVHLESVTTKPRLDWGGGLCPGGCVLS